MQYTSDTIGELSAALAKAQGEMQNAPLNKVNPHFRSKYADLAAIRDTVTPALSKHGLTVTQLTGLDDNGQFVLFTHLSHSSGEWLKGVYPLPLDPSKPQQMGSAITYARRYTLAAMVGIAADEDDDANAAQTNGQQQPAKTYGGTAKRGAAAQSQAQPAQPAQQPASDPIRVIDAEGEEQTFKRTKRGALDAMQFIEDEIDRVQQIEDQATLWSENRATFQKLADTPGVAELRKAEGAQTLAERVRTNDQAFREYLEAA